MLEASLLEPVAMMDADEQQRLDEALARMRAAAAHMTEDEIMEKVIEIIDEDRARRRSRQAEMPTAS